MTSGHVPSLQHGLPHARELYSFLACQTSMPWRPLDNHGPFTQLITRGARSIARWHSRARAVRWAVVGGGDVAGDTAADGVALGMAAAGGRPAAQQGRRKRAAVAAGRRRRQGVGARRRISSHSRLMRWHIALAHRPVPGRQGTIPPPTSSRRTPGAGGGAASGVVAAWYGFRTYIPPTHYCTCGSPHPTPFYPYTTRHFLRRGGALLARYQDKATCRGVRLYMHATRIPLHTAASP